MRITAGILSVKLPDPLRSAAHGNTAVKLGAQERNSRGITAGISKDAGGAEEVS